MFQCSQVLVGCLPASVAIYGFHVENRLVIGLSWVAGVVLQTVIPPWNLELLRLLAVTVLFTLIYGLSNPPWTSHRLYPVGLAVAVILVVQGIALLRRSPAGSTK